MGRAGGRVVRGRRRWKRKPRSGPPRRKAGRLQERRWFRCPGRDGWQPKPDPQPQPGDEPAQCHSAAPRDYPPACRPNRLPAWAIEAVLGRRPASASTPPVWRSWPTRRPRGQQPVRAQPGTGGRGTASGIPLGVRPVQRPWREGGGGGLQCAPGPGLHGAGGPQHGGRITRIPPRRAASYPFPPKTRLATTWIPGCRPTPPARASALWRSQISARPIRPVSVDWWRRLVPPGQRPARVNHKSPRGAPSPHPAQPTTSSVRCRGSQPLLTEGGRSWTRATLPTSNM
jgi:hypothetical protein